MSARIRTPGCPIRCCRPVFPKRRKRSRRNWRIGPKSGWLNIVGGCCGTTPPHIKACWRSGRRISAARSAEGRTIAALERPGSADRSGPTRISSTSASARTSPVRRNFRKLILAGKFEEAARRRQAAGRKRRADHRRQHGRGHARWRQGDDAFPESHRLGAGHFATCPS